MSESWSGDDRQGFLSWVRQQEATMTTVLSWWGFSAVRRPSCLWGSISSSIVMFHCVHETWFLLNIQTILLSVPYFEKYNHVFFVLFKQAAMWEPLLKQKSLKLAKYWLKAVYNSQLLVFGADIYLLWSCLLLLLFIIWPHPFFQLSASNMEQCLRQPWSNLSNLLIPLIITQPLF